MTTRHITAALALTSSTALGAGLALGSIPAYAVASTRTTTHHAVKLPASHRGSIAPLSAARLAEVRAQELKMAAGSTAPSFATTGAKTFTVDTTDDSDLADPSGTTCVDAATGACSLRAAVDAANNREKPVRILLGAHTYLLSTATALKVTNSSGTSLVGRGDHQTTVRAAGSGVFDVEGLDDQAAALLFVSDVKVTGGAAVDGGGFRLGDDERLASLALDHVIISGNSADNRGGGIYADNADTIYARHSQLVGNTASEGGGMYAYWGDIDLTDVAIRGNACPDGDSPEGGGLSVDYGVVRVKGGSISDNTAGARRSFGDGAAISSDNASVSLTDVHVDHNSAGDGDGGAIHTESDLFQVTGGTISHNHATGPEGRGGGIYEDQGSQLDLHDVTMTGNRVSGRDTPTGGAIYLDAHGGLANETTINQGSKITGSNGTAIYAWVSDGQVDLRVATSTLSNNHNTAENGVDDAGCGGAFYSDDVQGGSAFTQVTMSGNKAASEGGAYYGDSDNYLVTFVSSTISGNTAGTSSTTGGAGGGIFALDSVLTVENSTLTGNRALSQGAIQGQGGAIWHSGQGLTLRYSTISGNVAKIGGGIFSNASGGTLIASIVSRNHSAPHGMENDCAVGSEISRLNSAGGNVLGVRSCVQALQGSDKVTKNLHLGKLKSNGGPTKTMAISAKSPAVGRATFQIPGSDQRGHRRPSRHADAGAFELPKVKKHHHHHHH